MYHRHSAMAKIICPSCNAPIPVPKRRRPLSGPGISHANSGPRCPNCDPDLRKWNEERRALRKRTKGEPRVFLTGAVICVILAFLCIAGGIIIFDLEPRPPWARPVELAFQVGTQVFLALGMLLKIATQLFEQP